MLYFRSCLALSSHSFSGRFTSIAVDKQVETPDGKKFDVMFVGTGEGELILGSLDGKSIICK